MAASCPLHPDRCSESSGATCQGCAGAGGGPVLSSFCFFFPAGFATHHSGGAVVAAFALSSANAQKEIVFKFSTCRMLCDAWELSQV